jgi:hypothetical protein
VKAALAAVFIAVAAGGAWLAFAGSDECRAQASSGDVEARPGCASTGATACAASAGFVRAAAVPKGRKVRFRFTRKAKRGGATIEVFQSSTGRRILGRRIARFRNRKRSFTWSARGARDGYLFARFRAGKDVRTSTLRRHSGRFARGKGFSRRASCTTLARFELTRPVFGGRGNRALRISYRVGTRAKVSVVVRRGKKVVRRFRARSVAASRTVRLRFASKKRGRHRVQITVRPQRGVTTRASLYAQRL